MSQAGTPLDHERYVNLETFRKDGSGVKTPVWAAPLAGKLVVVTDGTSYKARRLRNDPRCRVAGCDARGRKVHTSWYEGTCRFLEDAGDIARADAALGAKYRWQYSLLNLFSRLGGRRGPRAYLEIAI